MRMRTVWLCEDADDATQSYVGLTKRGAETRVAVNRGYRTAKECQDDGWAFAAVEVSLPTVIVGVLFRAQGDRE